MRLNASALFIPIHSIPVLLSLPHVFDSEKDGEHGEHQNDGRNGLLFTGLTSKFQPE